MYFYTKINYKFVHELIQMFLILFTSKLKMRFISLFSLC